MGRLDGWIVFPALVTALVFIIGLMLKHNLYLTASDMGIVQDIGHHHDPVADAVALAIHYGLDGPPGVIVLLAGAGLVFLLKRSITDALFVLLLTTAGWGAAMVMKFAVGRERPEPRLLSDVLVPGLERSMSFPSGHTAFAVSLAIALSLAAWGTSWRTAVAVASTLFALVVAVSRVYLGVHYPSDVLASGALSIAAVVFVAGLATRVSSTRAAGASAAAAIDQRDPRH